MTTTNFKNMTKAELIALVQAQAQEVTQAQEAQAQAQKKVQEVTGLSADRLAYEEKKYAEETTCTFLFPDIFTQDTVQYRAQRIEYLAQLGRKYIQEVVQAQGKVSAGKQAGKRRNTSAGRKAGTSAGKAQDKSANDVYRYLCNTCLYEVQEAEKYSTIKKDGKTVARVYVMRDNKLKFLVKEDTAKKAGFAYTLMKFNLPASVILQNSEDVDKIVKAF